MKDRVREAVFNLIGPRVVGKQVIDLFSGTGAMAFEALSRGALRAFAFERKFPTAKLIETTADEFGLGQRVTVTPGDTFVWGKRAKIDASAPWLIFCCPPYELYVTRRSDVLDLVSSVWNAAPPSSVLVVESDERFDPAVLIPAVEWDVRGYPPAVIGIVEKA
jgi:16S rRNA (guanine966-N2)-methyltransferase